MTKVDRESFNKSQPYKFPNEFKLFFVWIFPIGRKRNLISLESPANFRMDLNDCSES